MFETLSMLNDSNPKLLNFGSCVANPRYPASVPRRASALLCKTKDENSLSLLMYRRDEKLTSRF